ncbi:MAG: hypothetical protein A2782_01980 [Candidatus Blackburnbacteria bacterium RIFCSPHIGHO2_01_FULL_43_15b]|uniref:Uncharacterized protein n=1 Tax=Candidatus Blackburnbacteria bacterium RIFCSPHIGHO2_01_FULL_43_15b TaxID=1797513 RepID=A0A1G1UY10_9BACT|nr:MAG: hypothetical protein A2782_01980 [Candidatus Blackburnbacteria bacterium RIFCSPHIGHO2_01_FULL_43_15b]
MLNSFQAGKIFAGTKGKGKTKEDLFVVFLPRPPVRENIFLPKNANQRGKFKNQKEKLYLKRNVI